MFGTFALARVHVARFYRIPQTIHSVYQSVPGGKFLQTVSLKVWTPKSTRGVILVGVSKRRAFLFER